MEINATLFVQMLNFLLAYVFIDRIVLRLAVAIVRAEDRKLGALESETSEHEKRITSRIRYNEDDWIILQKRLQSECPKAPVGQHTQALYEEPSHVPEPSPEQVKRLAEPLKDSLVKAILTTKGGHG